MWPEGEVDAIESPLLEAKVLRWQRWCRTLRRARQARGWTQETLAGKAGLDRSTVVRLETGETWGEVPTLVGISLALNLTLAGDSA